MRQLIIWFGILFTILVCPLSHGAVSAQVDQNQVQEGQSLELHLAGQGSEELKVDLAPLGKDFQVLGTSRSSNIAIINGRMESNQGVTIGLMPLRAGNLQIPPLTVNGEQTKAIPIQVVAAGAATSSGGAEAFLEAELTPKEPYVQAQMVLTLRLHHEGQITEGSLETPSSPEWLVETMGKDRKTTAQVGGKTLQVVERRYALFPQKSGEIVLEGAVFQGKSVVSQGKRNRNSAGSQRIDPFFGNLNLLDPFQNLQETRAIRLQAGEKRVNVRPRPKDHSAPWWLPAEQLVITDSWSVDPATLQIGVPATLTLTMNAKGLMAAALPELSPPQVDGLKFYPDQPVHRTQTQGEWMLGERVEKWALVPTKGGTFTLPAMEVVWWNTKENHAEIASVSPRTLTVAPSVATNPATPTPQIVEPQSQNVPSPEPVVSTHSASAAQTASPSYWPWLAGVFFLGWMATLYAWQRPNLRLPRRVEKKAAKPKLTGVGAACHGQNPVMARNALLSWAAASWPQEPPKTLQQLAERLAQPRAQSLLAELDRLLYARSFTSWNGQLWWQELQPFLTTAPTIADNKAGGLPPLNPTRPAPPA